MNRRKWLKENAANLLTLGAAALILVAVVFFSPWADSTAILQAQMGQQAAQAGASGFTPPAGFTPGQFATTAATGGTATPSFDRSAVLSTLAAQIPGLQTPFEITLLLLAAAGIALLAAGWSFVEPRHNRTIPLVIVLAGLLGALHFAYFFGVQNPQAPVSLTGYLTLGFWLATAGTVGLFVQAVLPRRQVVSQLQNSPLKAQWGKGGASVGFWQNLAVAFDALRANKLRSALTMLGVVIGVMAVVGLMSVGQGAQAAVTSQIEGIGTNLISVSAARGAGLQTVLTLDDSDTIAEMLEGMAYVAPQYSGGITAAGDDTSLDTTVIGTSADYFIARNQEIELGRLFSDEEYDSKERVVVLGSSAAEELFPDTNPIGYSVRLNNQRFEVIGVLEEQDSLGFSDPNAQVYVPLTAGYRYLFSARALASTDYRVSSITISAIEGDDVDTIIAQVESLLRDLHGLGADEDDDFTVADQQQLLETASTVTATLTVLLGAIAGISLLVGGIGIMNITLVSVTERTKEIGLRKALGARRMHIMQQFLIETVVLSTLGGIIGVLGGVGIAALVSSSGLLTTSVTPLSILLGLGFSVAVGIFFGVYPASRAAALHPIEALRYE